MWVDRSDGRIVGVPLAWFSRLLQATPEQREAVRSAAAACIGKNWMMTSPSPVCWPARAT